METIDTVLETVRNLNPDDIRDRLSVMDAEQKALRVLLGATLRAQQSKERKLLEKASVRREGPVLTTPSTTTI